ncbi:MAG: S1-like domain-containing RNA-binding protein [Prevotella sp.]|jgi:predicted RNA-binding protein (virulence factor B family)|nr:S1-like domain-containing RNA-binding protein [Prevotella sp.]MCI1282385.1 S1-like domain-containing RNA-binding protein [Prevotella sp.]
MEKIKLGDYNTLAITKAVDFGLYLDGGEEGEILLPKRYVPAEYKIGDELKVFIYLDQDERPVATTEQPLAKVGDFAYLQCAWVNEYGAFLNWGLMKDLFCPFREQKRRMETGESYIVHVHIDEESYRIMASAKVEHYFAEEPPSYEQGQEVDLLIWQKTELGFKVIIDNRYPGLVYEDQVFKYVHTGDRMKGYIATLREDGKIDVTLQPIGRKQVLDFAETLLEYLKEHDGACELGDKSDAEEIRRRFQVSKKIYKKGISDLYKRHLIIIGEDGIKLVK